MSTNGPCPGAAAERLVRHRLRKVSPGRAPRRRRPGDPVRGSGGASPTRSAAATEAFPVHGRSLRRERHLPARPHRAHDWRQVTAATVAFSAAAASASRASGLGRHSPSRPRARPPCQWHSFARRLWRMPTAPGPPRSQLVPFRAVTRSSGPVPRQTVPTASAGLPRQGREADVSRWPPPRPPVLRPATDRSRDQGFRAKAAISAS